MNEKEITKNRMKLIKCLKKKKNECTNWFEDNEINDLEEVINSSASGNTFRSFQNLPQRPSDIYRDWARKHLNHQIPKEIMSLSSKEEYDKWLEILIEDFARYWEQEMGIDDLILYGPKRKLTNLLMKRLTLWTEMSCTRKKLIQFLHVPLDSRSLSKIRNCIYRKDYAESIGKIPRRVTMNFIINKEMYESIQIIINKIAARAQVPPIYMDVLAWNFQQ
jgi:hypothetical protein